MAGRPVLAAMIAELARRAVEAQIALYDSHGHLRTDDSAEAYAFAWLSGGAPTGQLPTPLALANAIGCKRPLLHAWLVATPERKERLRIARVEAAGYLVDQSLSMLDESNPADLGINQARANFRKWLAGVMDRQTYGQAQAPTVAISVGHMHLQAHAALKAGRPAELAEPAPVALPASDVAILDTPNLLADNDLLPEELL